MVFLNRLFGKRKEQSIPEPSPMIEKPSEKEIFESPSMLAAWVDEFIVRSSSVEDDFNLAPDEDVRDSLNITYEQVERLAREEGLLRAVGACFLIKHGKGDPRGNCC